MKNKWIDEIFAKKEISKIDKIDNKITKMSEKVHMFNPLLTIQKPNYVYFNVNIKNNNLTSKTNSNIFLTTASSLTTEENLKNKLNESNEKNKKRPCSILIDTEETRENNNENLDTSLLLDKLDMNRVQSSLNNTDPNEIRLPDLREKLKKTYKEHLVRNLINEKFSKYKLSIKSFNVNNYLNHLKKESKYSTEKFSSYSGNRSNTRANSYLKTPNSITFDYAFNCI